MTRASRDGGTAPRSARAAADEVTAATDRICAEHLDAEYAELCRKLIGKLARKRPSPLLRGEARVWAGAVLHTVGMVNFLFDKTQRPHMTTDQLAKAAGAGKSTLSRKSQAICDLLRIVPMDPELCRRELLADNPLAWMIEVNGLILDARTLPLEVQAEARRRGLIPDLSPGAAPVSREAKVSPAKPRLYTLEVCIVSGPITRAFARKNRVLCRTIQIRGDQTLEDLHRAIFDAFDREEEHMYEFQVGGKGPMDPRARRYVLPMAMGQGKAAGSVTRTTIASLGLAAGDAFGYWFDFGDDWWHQINVIAVEDQAGRGKYPKVTKRVGESPPQYGLWDEEEWA